MKVKTELLRVCFATLADKMPYVGEAEVSYFFIRAMIILLRWADEHVLADELQGLLIYAGQAPVQRDATI